MALNKFDKASDAVADLYRASFYLGRKSENVGISFLIKAKKKLGKKLFLEIKRISFKKPSDYFYWAEKILDEYKRLKNKNLKKI